MYFRNQKVLLTGSAGLVGSNLIPRLLAEGAQVRAAYHRTEPARRDPRVEYVQSDLTRPEDCARAVDGVKFVFHLAAKTPGAAATASSPLEHITANLVIDARMFEASYRAGVEKFLWLSSATTGYPPADHPVKEEEFFAGEPYPKYFAVGWSKRITEILSRMYGAMPAEPLTAIVLRASYIYGPGDDFEFATAHVIPALIRKAVERHDPIEVWGTGEDVRDPIFVEDVVAAMLTAMEQVSSYDVFNIALGKGYSVKDMLKMILELDGYADARIAFDSSKPTMIPVRLVDVSKTERILGFRAKTDLAEGLRKTIDWYREVLRLPVGH